MSKEWHKLNDLATKRFKTIPTNSGVYYLRRLKDEKLVCVARLNGLDNEGILYIGSARDLKNRIRRLWKAINGKVNAHTIGKTIIFCGVNEIVSLKDYEIKWAKSDVGKEIHDEWKAIHSYAVKFKEPPPLNLGLRREMFGLWGLGIWGKSKFTD
jgi:hypothetical protein